MLYTTMRLTSKAMDQQPKLNNWIFCLKAWGYSKSMIINIILKSYNKIRLLQTQSNATIRQNKNDNSTTCFFQLPHHPRDPKSNILQSSFREEIIKPKGAITNLPGLHNHKGHLIGIDLMIVAYHRTLNIGNFLSPRIRRERNMVHLFHHT
jgi:hypothetical protein